MRSTESRFLTGPLNILFSRVYVCTFQPGNFTGWGSEGVNCVAQFLKRSNLVQTQRVQKNAIYRAKHILPFLIDFCCCFHVV